MFVNTQKLPNIGLSLKIQNYVVSVYRNTLKCVNITRGTSGLSHNCGTNFSLWSRSTLFIQAETLFFFFFFTHTSARLACVPCVRTWQVDKVMNVAEKLHTKISQSGSQLKVLEQKRRALLERNACCRRRSVIGPGERVRVAVLGSHSTGAKPFFDLTLRCFFFVLQGKTSTV